MTLYPPHSSLKPGARVLAYLRDSGGTKQDESISRQETEVRRWCEAHGLILTDIYTDEAQSGTSIHKRKDLLSLMAYLRTGKAEERGVIIWNYERFARNIKHGRAFIAEIEFHDKVICSLTDNIPEGPERYFMQDLKLWSAEQTSVKISIDVTSGLRGMVETHGGMPGTPPRGFIRGAPITIGKHRDGSPRIVHRWEPDPDLIETVRLAYEMRARGATYKQIMDATQLYPSVNSYTTFFPNRLYMGILEFGDLIIPNYCAPIVTAELWERANAVNAERRTASPSHNLRRYASTFLFSGLIYCQHCGAPLNGRVIAEPGKKRRDYYVCSRSTRRRDCPARNIPARALEEKLIQQLEDLALSLDRMILFQAKVTEHYKRLAEQAGTKRLDLRRKLNQQNKRIANLTDTIANNGGTPSLITALRESELKAASLTLELRELETNLTTPELATPAQLTHIAAQIKQALHGDDLQTKKDALHLITARVIVKRTDSEIESALQYIPPVFVRSGTPIETPTEGIHFFISIPKYAPRPK